MARNKIVNVSSGILFLALLGGCSSQGIQPPKQAAVQRPSVTTTPVVRARKSNNRIIRKQVKKRVFIKRSPPKKIVRRSVNTQKIAQQRAIKKRATQQWLAQQRATKKRQQKHYLAQRRVVRKAPRKYVAPRYNRVRKAPRKYVAPRYNRARKAPRKYVAPRYNRPRTAPRRYVAPPPRYIARRAPKKVYIRPIQQYQPVRQQPVRQQPIRSQQPYLRKASLSGDFSGNPKAHRFIDKMVGRYGFDRQYLNGLLSNAQATNWMRKMAAKDDRPKIRRKPSSKRNRTPSWSRYRAHFLTSRHINAGVAFYRKNRQALERAERQFGVPKEYIMGIMGVETIFGGNVGKNRAIDALTTMAFKTTRRSRYFSSELESYLLMTRRSHLNPLTPKASYAGAVGLCQFMPSNIKKYGVDFDGDGGVNLWKPADAIASVAKYFSRHGWRTGEMVAVPARSRGKRYRTLKTGFKHTYSYSRLKGKGVSTKYSHNMRGKLSLIKLKTYGGDELWLGGKNFYVITRYNHSTHYAMAVHQLAQAIKQRIEPGARSGPRRAISPQAPSRKRRSISVEEAMELLSASNEYKDAVIQFRDLITKESIS